jgi:hypothetical protein
VTDNKACTKVESFIISALAVTTSSTNVACFGACNGTATANAAGGNLPYTITWTRLTGEIVTPGEMTPVSSTIINLCPGKYIASVLDSNNCNVPDTVTIIQPGNPMEIDSIVYAQILDCNGDSNGTARVFASGGTTPYSYQWENSLTPGFIIGTSDFIEGLSAGSYCVTVTDVNSCSDTACFTIFQPDPILLTMKKRIFPVSLTAMRVKLPSRM